jgi:hypothetical protein
LLFLSFFFFLFTYPKKHTHAPQILVLLLSVVLSSSASLLLSTTISMKKKNTIKTKHMLIFFVHLLAHVYFSFSRFFCFGLCWTYWSLSSFSFPFRFFSFSFSKTLQSSDMYVCMCVCLSDFISLGFLTCTCVYDDELVFHYKYFIRAYRWRQTDKKKEKCVNFVIIVFSFFFFFHQNLIEDWELLNNLTSRCYSWFCIWQTIRLNND